LIIGDGPTFYRNQNEWFQGGHYSLSGPIFHDIDEMDDLYMAQNLSLELTLNRHSILALNSLEKRLNSKKISKKSYFNFNIPETSFIHNTIPIFHTSII
jgi:hypothetical protein